MKDEPLRVASLFGTLVVGGDENRCLAFARHAPRDRIEHEVLVVARPSPERMQSCGDMPSRYAEHGVGFSVLGLPGRMEASSKLRRAVASPMLFSRAVRKLRSWLISRRIDVVDARLPTGIALGTAAAVGLPVAVVGTDYFPDWWERGRGRALRRPIFARLDALVTDSHYMGARFRRHLPGRVRVIHNGIPDPVCELDEAGARARLGLPSGVPVLTQVSRLIPYKGQADALEILARVVESVPSAHLVLCGFDGQVPGFADELRHRAAELGLADQVRVGGYQGPIADVWAATDLQLHPTHRDSSPIAIHEAMARSLPAVVSDVAGIPELVEDGISGFVVAEGDVDTMAARAVQLLRDPAQRQQMGTRARQRWEARHRPEQMVQQTLDLFTSAATTHRQEKGGWRD